MPVEGSKAEVIYDDGEVKVKHIGDHVRISLLNYDGNIISLDMPTSTFKNIYRKWNHFQRKDK